MNTLAGFIYNTHKTTTETKWMVKRDGKAMKIIYLKDTASE